MAKIHALIHYIDADAAQDLTLPATLSLDDVLLRQVAVLLDRFHTRKGNTAFDDPLGYIRQNLDRPHRLSDLDMRSRASQRALQSAFRQKRKCTPKRWIRQQGLKAAMERLRERNGSASVHATALNCGDRNLNLFSLDFKQHGRAPHPPVTFGLGGCNLESTSPGASPLAVRPVLRLGDPRLRLPSIPVPEEVFGTERLAGLLTDLRDTMAAHDGAGLASPQIGVPWRVVIYGGRPNPRYPEAPPIPETVLITPRITPVGAATQLGWEGCLSVPGLRGQVERWQTVRITWRDPNGEAHESVVAGFEARVAQHECDHLDGVLFPDRLHHPHAFGFSDVLRAAGVL